LFIYLILNTKFFAPTHFFNKTHLTQEIAKHKTGITFFLKSIKWKIFWTDTVRKSGAIYNLIQFLKYWSHLTKSVVPKVGGEAEMGGWGTTGGPVNNYISVVLLTLSDQMYGGSCVPP